MWACKSDGSNSRRYFPEKTTKIYLRWRFENFFVGSHYERIWRVRGVSGEWAHYDCSWPGPETGIEEITLTEPDGLYSGEWVVSIKVDGKVVWKESLFVEGDWDYWSPAGYFGSCYGKR